MVEISNSRITDKLAQSTGSRPIEDLPRQIGKEIVPIIDANPPDELFIFRQSVLTTGNSAVMAAPSNSRRTFYIVYASLGMMDDVTSDNVATFMSVTLMGSSLASRFIEIPKLTLTVKDDIQSRDFSAHPLPVAPDTTITISNSFTVGNSIKQGTIIGFFRENRS